MKLLTAFGCVDGCGKDVPSFKSICRAYMGVGRGEEGAWPPWILKISAKRLFC